MQSYPTKLKKVCKNVINLFKNFNFVEYIHLVVFFAYPLANLKPVGDNSDWRSLQTVVCSNFVFNCLLLSRMRRAYKGISRLGEYWDRDTGTENKSGRGRLYNYILYFEESAGGRGARVGMSLCYNCEKCLDELHT